MVSGITELIFVTGCHKHVIEDRFDAWPELEAEFEAKGKLQLLDVAQKILPNNVNCILCASRWLWRWAVLCARSAVGNEPFAVLLADDLMIGPTPITQQLIRTY